MFLRKEKKKKEKSKVIHLGTHNVRVYVLWGVLIMSFLFAVYKNFTGIDIHTIHEKEIIKEKLLSTNGIENFASDFAAKYFSWGNDKESIDKRAESVQVYVTERLKRYVVDMVPSDVGSSSSVYKNSVWDVEKTGSREYEVVLEIGQKITQESGSKKIVNMYAVGVYVDENGDMLISRLPTISSIPAISTDNLEEERQITEVDSETKEDINGFLKDFFAIYPMSDEKELKYYANEGIMPVIQSGAFEFERIEETVITAFKEDIAEVSVKVTYKSLATNTNQTYQYKMTLVKQDNWKIAGLK